MGYSPLGCKELDRAEQLSMRTEHEHILDDLMQPLTLRSYSCRRAQPANSNALTRLGRHLRSSLLSASVTDFSFQKLYLWIWFPP